MTIKPDFIKWVNDDTYSACDLETDAPRKGKLKFYVETP